MLLENRNLALEMEFITRPPPSAYAGDVLTTPAVICFAPFANHQDFTPWVPGPGEGLHFQCEFIPDGAGPGSSNHHICRTAFVKEVFNSEFLGGPTMIGFELRIVPNPGNYFLQVTGYLLREGIDPVVLKRISSGPIKVLKASGSRRATE